MTVYRPLKARWIKERSSRAEPDQREQVLNLGNLCSERCLCDSEQEVGERMQTLQLNGKISVGRKCPGGLPLKTGSMPE